MLLLLINWPQLFPLINCTSKAWFDGIKFNGDFGRQPKQTFLTEFDGLLWPMIGHKGYSCK